MKNRYPASDPENRYKHAWIAQLVAIGVGVGLVVLALLLRS